MSSLARKREGSGVALLKKSKVLRRDAISPYFEVAKLEEGETLLISKVHGIELLRLVLTNKGTAFSEAERVDLGLDGLLPPKVCQIEEQLDRAYENFLRQANPIDKYQYLRGLQERQEVLFYALVCRHLKETLPIIYTPTVGEAVSRFSALFETPRGLTVTPENIDRIDTILDNYPLQEPELMVVTDSSAILGIGDQGVGGLAISIGKLALYTAAGRMSPFRTIPVCLDCGTNQEGLRSDCQYIGRQEDRLGGDGYFDFVDRFVAAVGRKWPKVVIQWEDLSKDTAFDVLSRYQDSISSFNDDIQGTGAVALAGLLRAVKIAHLDFCKQKIAIVGAGAGGLGVALAIRGELQREGLSAEDISECLFVFDSGGLMHEGRGLVGIKKQFETPMHCVSDTVKGNRVSLDAEFIGVQGITTLIGLSGQPGFFSESMVRGMGENTSRPIIFPLSNPTRLSEGVPEVLMEWTRGKAIVATGSPFPDVPLKSGTVMRVGQGNNAFVFPGLGVGAVLTGASRITEGMVATAAHALANYMTARFGDDDTVYPDVAELPMVSRVVAREVALKAIEEGVGTKCFKDAVAVEDALDDFLWKPNYFKIVSEKLFEREYEW
ncbi:MAG: oxaloacetate-decarboxylating malate dehydrogenase [Myxococcota bacterium]|nr:oxaloacetate-decarboxylating malate dehydrogenase [Myxococcota bacterium]